MIGKLERAIPKAIDAKLGRMPFVARLCDALVDPAKGASTGIAFGGTGPWGSGKSSILNMIEEQVTKEQPDAVSQLR